MQEHPYSSPNPSFKRFLLGFSLSILALGGGTTLLAWQVLKTPPEPVATISGDSAPPTSSDITSPDAPTSPQKEPVATRSTSRKQVEVFWLTNDGDRLALASHLISTPKSAADVTALESALLRLLSGPSDHQQVTTIPAGTKLLSLKINTDGIHIDLSKTFTTGNGSAAMNGRLGQVIYTATSLEPKAAVWLSVEGKPLEILGDGLGLEVEQPMTREIFDQNFEL